MPVNLLSANPEDYGSYQWQTILNLYNSGIAPDIIAMQLDITEQDVMKVIQSVMAEEEKKKVSVKQVSGASSLGSFYLDAIIDINLAIRNAQERVWKALRLEPEFTISHDQTREVLEKLAKSKTNLVILHIDLVGSTRLSMTLPVDRLATLVKAFTQEMSRMISSYGGYILKYIGDAILAFFLVDPEDSYLSCINAISCARSMVRVVGEGINPILNQYDYPEMNVRIGIDMGENAVVQYGWDTYRIDGGQIRKPHLDILGYTISIATKMTALAKPDQIIIGQSVYEAIDEKEKANFLKLPINEQIWNYVGENTGDVYQVYGSTS